MSQSSTAWKVIHWAFVVSEALNIIRLPASSKNIVLPTPNGVLGVHCIVTFEGTGTFLYYIV